MKISCSCCAANHEFKYSATNVIHAVYTLGWGSYGAALYCPKCTATWDQRNKGRPQPGPESTISLLDDLYRRSKRRFSP